MAPKLTPEEIVTLSVLKGKGQSNAQIAHTLGVSEGAIRYHLQRQGQPDGRKNKPRKADALAEVIDHWIFTQQPQPFHQQISKICRVEDFQAFLINLVKLPCLAIGKAGGLHAGAERHV